MVFQQFLQPYRKVEQYIVALTVAMLTRVEMNTACVANCGSLSNSVARSAVFTADGILEDIRSVFEVTKSKLKSAINPRAMRGPMKSLQKEDSMGSSNPEVKWIRAS